MLIGKKAMLGQRVVENFFKRAKFRRSKRVRGSIRASSLIRREAKMSASVENSKPGSIHPTLSLSYNDLYALALIFIIHLGQR